MLADHVLTVHWKYSNWFATWLHLWGVVAAPSLIWLSSNKLHSQLFRQLQFKFSLRYLRLKCTLCIISPTSVLQLEWQSHHQAMTQWKPIQNNLPSLELGRQVSGNRQWHKRGRGTRKERQAWSWESQDLRALGCWNIMSSDPSVPN